MGIHSDSEVDEFTDVCFRLLQENINPYTVDIYPEQDLRLIWLSAKSESVKWQCVIRFVL